MISLKIEIPEGYEIDKISKDTGEISFKRSEPKISSEQKFVDMFDGCVIRLDMERLPECIFYFDVDGNFLARYDSDKNIFCITSKNGGLGLWGSGIALVEKYLKLKDLEEVSLLHPAFCHHFEQHFKSKPNSQ